MKLTFIAISFIFISISCENQANKREFERSGKQNSPEKIWKISATADWLKNQGLLNVESIIHDEVNQVFYATNGVNYEQGTDGFISIISETGALQELKWVDQLNRPTGMAIRNSLLYVADVNALVVIDTRNGKVIEKYMEPIANSGLNDVSISPDGTLYVSASFIHSVLILYNGKLKLWSADDEKLAWGNGLIANDEQILVAGLNLSVIDVTSKEITKIELRSPVKDFDGLVMDGSGGYFLTTVENSALFHLSEQKNVSKLMEGDLYFGDLEFIPESKKIFIPRGDKETKEFFITVLTVEQEFLMEELQ